MTSAEVVKLPPIPSQTAQLPGGVLLDEPEADSPVKPLTVWTPDELLAWTPPSDAVIIGDANHGYVVREELTVIIGPPGTGKSRLLTWGAICAITGRQFAGLGIQNSPTKWLLIGNENSRRRQRYDLERMMSTLTNAERESVRSNLRIHVLDQARDSLLDLGDRGAREAIAATLRLHTPDVVVFDPWANMVPGDENKNSDVRDGVRHLLNLVRLNAPRAACIVVHHARTGAATVAQAGNRFSGASLSRGGKALPSAARCEIAVWPGDAEDGGRIVVTCEKSNNAPIFAPRGLILDPESMTYDIDPSFNVEAWRDDVSGKKTNQSASIADVFLAVKSICRYPGDTAKTSELVQSVKDATGASVRTVKTRLADALKLGYLRKGKTLGTYMLGAKPLNHE